MDILLLCFNSQAVYKMSVAASLSKPNLLTAEECTNRIFVRLDKDNNGEGIVFSLRQSHVNNVIMALPLWQ